MFKEIHAQEDIEAAEKKAANVVAKLRDMKLSKVAKIVEEGVSEMFSWPSRVSTGLEFVRTIR